MGFASPSILDLARSLAAKDQRVRQLEGEDLLIVLHVGGHPALLGRSRLHSPCRDDLDGILGTGKKCCLMQFASNVDSNAALLVTVAQGGWRWECNGGRGPTEHNKIHLGA